MPFVTLIFANMIPASVTMTTNDIPPQLERCGGTTLEFIKRTVQPEIPNRALAMQQGLPPNPPGPTGQPANPTWLVAPGNLPQGDSSAYWARLWIPDNLPSTFTAKIEFGGGLLLGGARRKATKFSLTLNLQPDNGPNALTASPNCDSSQYARITANLEWRPFYDEWAVALNLIAINLKPKSS